jgi:uncharacterized membrane protein
MGSNMDLLAIIALTFLIELLIYGVPVEPVRAALGVLFVLFFPGYALVSALYPRREPLGGVERIARGLGLSLALVPLLGLALNFTPWGIGLTPIVVTLSLWTLALSGVAWFQRRRIAPEGRFDIPWSMICRMVPQAAASGRPDCEFRPDPGSAGSYRGGGLEGPAAGGWGILH